MAGDTDKRYGWIGILRLWAILLTARVRRYRPADHLPPVRSTPGSRRTHSVIIRTRYNSLPGLSLDICCSAPASLT